MQTSTRNLVFELVETTANIFKLQSHISCCLPVASTYLQFTNTQSVCDAVSHINKLLIEFVETIGRNRNHRQLKLGKTKFLKTGSDQSFLQSLINHKLGAN